MTASDEPTYWALVAPYFEAVSIYDGPVVFLEQLEKIPEPSRRLLTSHWTQSEIRNGGVLQYFLNNTGVLAPEAVAGFRRLGMDQTADVLGLAVARFGQTYPRDRGERENILEEMLPGFDFDEDVDLDEPYPFDDLEDRMLALLNSENGGFEQNADAFARTHKK